NRLVRLFAGAAGLMLVTIVPALGAGAVSDRTSRVVPIAAGTPIRIDATIADLTITGSTRPDVRIDVERRVPKRDDLAKLLVTIDESRDGVHVAVVQQDDQRSADAKAIIAITVPSDAVLQPVRVFEGSVKLVNLRGSCDVDLRRGVIDGDRLA